MPRIDDSSLTERQQYWLKHLRAHDASGRATIDCAREHGIKAKSMYSARKALAEKELPVPQEFAALHPSQIKVYQPISFCRISSQPT